MKYSKEFKEEALMIRVHVEAVKNSRNAVEVMVGMMINIGNGSRSIMNREPYFIITFFDIAQISAYPYSKP